MANMQFWGVDVKSKQPTQVSLEEGQVIHLSQATLGEVKKDKETVTIHVKIGEQKLVLGMLSQTTPQLTFDLVFDEDFEISHNWKNGSVHLMGYQTAMEDDDGSTDIFSDSSDDEEVPVLQKENGKLPEAAKPKVASKPAKEVKPKPEEKDDSEDDSDDDEDDSDEDGDSDEDMLGISDDSEDDDEDDDDDESEDEKPAKADSGKKRPNADAKTPESKKAKLATPQKTDGKKGSVHIATPHPSKKGGKTPGSEKSPKSGGQASCGPCKKSFNSDVALQSHKKAKHGGK